MKTVGIDFDPRNYGFSKLSELIAAIVFLKSTEGKKACMRKTHAKNEKLACHTFVLKIKRMGRR